MQNVKKLGVVTATLAAGLAIGVATPTAAHARPGSHGPTVAPSTGRTAASSGGYDDPTTLPVVMTAKDATTTYEANPWKWVIRSTPSGDRLFYPCCSL